MAKKKRKAAVIPVMAPAEKRRILMWALAVIAFFTLALIGAYGNEKKVLVLSIGSMLAGITLEVIKITDRKETLIVIGLGTLLFSIFASFSTKVGLTIEKWMITFVLAFVIVACIAYGKKLIIPQSEGTALLQSIALLYWIADFQLTEAGFLFLFFVLPLGVFMVPISLFHAFTKKPHTKSSRLWLSIWSASVMLLFAFENISHIWLGFDTHNYSLAYDVFVSLQFFVLGVSAMYIAQNAMMLLGFLPGKHEFFNSAYFKRVKELQKDHVDRFSAQQVRILHSLICIFFTGLVFGLNLYFHFLPRHIIIWLVFIIFPYIIMLYHFAKGTPQTITKS